MSSAMKKNEGTELFTQLSLHDELRALLRPGFTDEQLAALTPHELADRGQEFLLDLQTDREARELVARHVSEGRLSEEAAAAMTAKDRMYYRRAEVVAWALRREVSKPDVPRQMAAPAAPLAATPSSKPDESGIAVVAILRDMLCLLNAQQVQIDELANDRDVFLARFADRMLERFRAFSESGRDFKGFEVTLDLEDESSRTREKSKTASGEEAASSKSTRDTHGEIQVLAKQIGALGAGRNVNLEEMNKRVAALAASSKSDVRAKWKGTVTVKVGEVSGEAKKS